MTEGRRRDEWARMSSWMAMFANCNRDQKKKREPFKPADFDPFTERPAEQKLSPADSIRALAAALGAKNMGVVG